MNLNQAVARVGHLATRRQLAALGFGRHTLERALAAGSLVKIRPGWVGTRAASQLAVIAVLQGGRLTAATALATYGVWSGTDRSIHVQIPANAHRAVQPPLVPLADFAAPEFSYRGIVRHWVPCQEPRATDAFWRVTVTDALLRFARTQNDEQLAASIESAVHNRLLSRSDVAELFLRLPRRQHPIRSRLTFQAESGLETVAGLRLAQYGHPIMQQVQIGPDRVDLVIDGFLVVELDGDKWHDPVTDRIRTNRLIRAGYRVLRFGYTDVFERWDDTLATIHEMLGVRHPVFRY
jgi:very-short-patch-repair endonuclease